MLFLLNLTGKCKPLWLHEHAAASFHIKAHAWHHPSVFGCYRFQGVQSNHKDTFFGFGTLGIRKRVVANQIEFGVQLAGGNSGCYRFDVLLAVVLVRDKCAVNGNFMTVFGLHGGQPIQNPLGFMPFGNPAFTPCGV